MSTPMIDFDRFDITAIVRQHSPFALNRTTVFFDGDRKSMFFICTEEEHEKLVADYLVWKHVKTARKSHIQQKIEFDRCRNEHLKKILAPAFNRIWLDIEEQCAKEKGDLASEMARDCGFSEPKQTPPMPHPFKFSHSAQNITPAVKIEEIEETTPKMPQPLTITLSFGRSNIDVHVSELVYGDVDKVAKRISDSYKENYNENLSVSDVKQEICHALLDSVFWRDTKK